MRRSAHRLRALGALALASAHLSACDDGASRQGVAPAFAMTQETRPADRADALRSQPVAVPALIATLGCGACHAGLPPPASPATPLAAGIGPRDPALLFVYLEDSLPAWSDVTGARMPDFHLDER
ncbi:MAG: hypothetical protein ACRELX_06945, partial [Longimicrobiales bacterium]